MVCQHVQFKMTCVVFIKGSLQKRWSPFGIICSLVDFPFRGITSLLPERRLYWTFSSFTCSSSLVMLVSLPIPTENSGLNSASRAYIGTSSLVSVLSVSDSEFWKLRKVTCSPKSAEQCLEEKKWIGYRCTSLTVIWGQYLTGVAYDRVWLEDLSTMVDNAFVREY